MKRIQSFFSEFLKTGFNFQDLFLISNIYVAIDANKKINAKKIQNMYPNALSLSSIHRRIHHLREKGIVDIQLDYADGRKTFIVKGPNYKSTITILQSVIDKNIQVYLDDN